MVTGKTCVYLKVAVVRYFVLIRGFQRPTNSTADSSGLSCRCCGETYKKTKYKNEIYRLKKG